MALPSFFKRKPPPAAAPAVSDPLADDAGPVQAARVRAPRRQIGAVGRKPKHATGIAGPGADL